jgi:hypothetical protein
MKKIKINKITETQKGEILIKVFLKIKINKIIKIIKTQKRENIKNH